MSVGGCACVVGICMWVGVRVMLACVCWWVCVRCWHVYVGWCACVVVGWSFIVVGLEFSPLLKFRLYSILNQ